jgi:hypothetical protein
VHDPSELEEELPEGYVNPPELNLTADVITEPNATHLSAQNPTELIKEEQHRN